MNGIWFPTAIFLGPGLVMFAVECLVFRLTRRRGWALRLLPAAALAAPALRWWEAWRYGGLFQPLTLLACELVTLSMLVGLLLGWRMGLRWAKRG